MNRSIKLLCPFEPFLPPTSITPRITISLICVIHKNRIIDTRGEIIQRWRKTKKGHTKFMSFLNPPQQITCTVVLKIVLPLLTPPTTDLSIPEIPLHHHQASLQTVIIHWTSFPPYTVIISTSPLPFYFSFFSSCCKAVATIFPK